MKNLRELYNLSYDESGFGSGLIQWYNALINKCINELEVADVARMVRQNILPDVAIKRAVELFLYNPYDGEHQDGELLSLLLIFDISVINTEMLSQLKNLLQKLKINYKEFDWQSKNAEEQYIKELSELESKISKLFP